MTTRSRLCGAAALWIIILVVGSLMPVGGKRALHTLNTSRASAHGSWNHRVAHFVGFGIAAFLLGLTVRTPGSRALTLTGTIALGIALEVIQHRLGKTPFELWDVRDDAIAAVFGIAAAIATDHVSPVFFSPTNDKN